MGMKMEGYEAEEARVKKIKKVYDDACRKYCDRMGLYLYETVVEKTPVDTGQLQRGWKRSSVYKTDKQFRQDVENNVDYAMHVEKGHRIKVNDKYVGYVEGQYFLEKSQRQYLRKRPEFLRQLRDEIQKGLK